jgi:apyrase
VLVSLTVLFACTPQLNVAPSSPASGSSVPAEHYALVIDASSSGSRVHVFRWRPSGEDELPWVKAAPFPRAGGEEAWQLVVDGGLSDYESNPEAAGRSLAPLIDFAASRLDGAGAALAATPLYLKATGGMRLVPEPARGRIMESVREFLGATPFDFRSAEIISGQQEGLFGWITVNYALGMLGDGGPFPTVGALDLGGASTQITFLPIDYPQDHGAKMELGGTSYDVYSYSYLGLGQDQARERVAAPVCFPKGYPIPDGGVGVGDYGACRQAIRETFGRPCEADSCSLMGVYQPPLYGDFFAFSAFGYTAAFFGQGQNLSLEALEESAAAYCATDWDEILEEYPGDGIRKYLPRYCYGAAHVVTLLNDGYGFPMNSSGIITPSRVQGSEISWVLGSFIYELAGSAD